MAPNTKLQFIRACSTGKSQVVRELLQAGMSPETRDDYGLTGLIWVGRKGNIQIAEILLDAGADIEGKDRRGRTSLHHAVIFKRYAFVEFLERVSKIGSASREVLTFGTVEGLSFCHEETAEAVIG